MLVWNKHIIASLNDLTNMIQLFKQLDPEVCAFDTETTGLNIITDSAFIFVFGFVKRSTGYVYLVDKRKNSSLFNLTIKTFISLAENKLVLAHNIKFDLHMLHNEGFPNTFKNLSDTMFYIRLSSPAVSKKYGGVPLDLTGYATRFIDKNARMYDRNLKQHLQSVKRERTRMLVGRLKDFHLPDEVKIKGTEKSWTNPIVEKLLNNIIDGDDLMPDDVKEVVDEVLSIDHLDPTKYYNVPTEVLHKYAHYDVVYTLEIYLKLKDTIVDREQEKTLQIENDLIIPLYEMERVGFNFNKEYALEAKDRVKKYILSLRKILEDLSGSKFTISQHAVIKEMFSKKFGIHLASSDEASLKRVMLNDEYPSDAKEIARTIMELRTLEKWFSTYIIKLLSSETEGRVYTSIHQVGAVSGRVSSDFQQFPRNPIKDREGNVLINVRHMFKVSGGDFPAMFYLDFSQIELRVQAMYTILLGKPDRNLCRAFVPYQCKNENGEIFSFTSKDHRDNFSKHSWVTLEDGKPWETTDLHSLTAINAFPEAKVGNPDFKKYRDMAKTTNFACNYGATAKAVSEQLNVSYAIGNRLVNAYRKSYPGVQRYRNYVESFIRDKGYIENLFGRRYYGMNSHEGSNYLIQGSAADLLKFKIIQSYKHIKEKGYKSRFQMNIHDELIFELHKDDPISIIHEIKEVLEKLEDSPIPIVSDAEITYTTWDEKYEL